MARPPSPRHPRRYGAPAVWGGRVAAATMAAVLAAGIGVALTAVPAAAGTTATTWYVSSSAGSDPSCAAASQADPFATIAGALACAQSGDTVSIGAGTFAGGFTVAANVVLTGAGAATVIDGPTADEVTVAAGATVEIDHLSVETGQATEGISATTGTVALLDVTVDGGDLATNDVVVAPGSGSAQVTVTDSTLANALDDGIEVTGASANPSTLSVTNSTVTGNGDGIVTAATDVDLRDDTVAANYSDGVTALTGTVTLADSILAGNNLSGGFGQDCEVATVDDGGHNLIGNASGSGTCDTLAGIDGNLVGTSTDPVDPKLGPLADNGGPTETLALLAGSPAIGGGDPTQCAAAPVSDLDQRGAPRDTTSRGACDIGAFDTGGTTATTWYVSSSAGSDPSCAAASQADPFATIAGALACAQSGDTVSIGAGTFAGGFTVAANVVLTGAGAATVIDGPTADEVTVAAGATVEIDHLSVETGQATEGISATTGTVALLDVTVDGGDLATNDVVVAPGSGSAQVTVTDSTLANALDDGIEVTGASANPSTLSVTNSTVTGNGDGIVTAATDVDLRDDTVAANYSDGVTALTGTVTLADSILAGNNLSGGFGQDCEVATVDDGGHNLIGNASGSGTCDTLAGIDGNLVGTSTDPVDPKLGPLADNGGPTETLALLAGSPAIGGGDPTQCAAAPVSDLDQRGAPRDTTSRGACDIGAFDTGGRTGNATTTLASVSPAAVDHGDLVTYSATVVGNSGVPSGTVAFVAGTTTLCTATLSSASGSCTTTAPPAGTDTITASYSGDGTFAPSTGTTTLTVQPPVAITTGTLPAATVDTAYVTTLAATGGTTPYTWSIESGSLPGGLALHASSGTITGTPTAAGTATFTVSVTDSPGTLRATKQLTLTVDLAQSQGTAPTVPTPPAPPAPTAPPTSPTSPTSPTPTVGTHGGSIGDTPDGKGWLVASPAGAVTAGGDATLYGSLAGQLLNQPVVGIASTADARGYWLVASDGGVFAFGDAAFYGSTGGIHLNQPVVGIASTPDAKGYWLVASDGGVFAFGDAAFYGSTGGIHLNQPVVGISGDPDGEGYWLVASDGGVFAFGNAAFYGSLGATPLNKAIAGLAPTPGSQGYRLVAGDGGVFAFGNAPFYGSLGATGSPSPTVGIVVPPADTSYRIIESDGASASFGSPS